MQENQADSSSEAETEDDLKRKFREALEHKKQVGQKRQAHEESRSKVSGMRREAGRKRNFRRKAG
ncbi:MAG TPA: DUF5302 domain-containing protein [Streptomyces sp.]|uniref:DUF5302 domain-containing protein n=1 Tax=Streptomyces sp. TaxID=1931 RepID=UPI002D66E772|nr:DUF5302 domain-containing protein [Streptomyces sp.]HZG07101.1 DUF5302 domain-containing protein [Streptomyces sp.]